MIPCVVMSGTKSVPCPLPVGRAKAAEKGTLFLLMFNFPFFVLHVGVPVQARERLHGLSGSRVAYHEKLWASDWETTRLEIKICGARVTFFR